MSERDIEQLLRMAREADRFERELLAPAPRKIRWLQPAIAACLVVAGLVAVLRPGEIVVEPKLAYVRASIAGADSHVVVALYRRDSATTERCPECWCVARWSADWGDGRSINEIEDRELVDDSIARSCVVDPKRVVIVGLSGPAASMPTSDQQALEMSLCLLGESNPTALNCVPAGVEYCMTSWSK